MNTLHHYFTKSDTGAQSAWKGFASQTLYIASRIINDTEDNLFYPEDIEDLILRKNDSVVEAVQIKNISSDLTLSSLATTKTTENGDGFFNRVCSLHAQFSTLDKITIVYFKTLGQELSDLSKGKEYAINSVIKKLTDNHHLSEDNAKWIVSSIHFCKVSKEDLENNIVAQLSDHVQTMAAPDLAKVLLIQYVSELSNSKGYTSLNIWKEKMHSIGTDLAILDGYFKEYNKSLVRLTDLHTTASKEKLVKEFALGISAHPEHIRNNLDFRRTEWCDRINTIFSEHKIAIIKGVSGQGKTTLCYRYLIDHYPEELVFCIRSIESNTQAENLANAILGISKHTSGIIVYIDVMPGSTYWSYFLQELFSRNGNVLAIASLRDEDYNLTIVNKYDLDIGVIELELSQQEAELIYEKYTEHNPHDLYRNFDEAWTAFGSDGPMIEFMFLLSNNHTLKERLQTQVDSFFCEKMDDSWLELLKIVCYAGKSGCIINFDEIKEILSCHNIHSAIKRFSDEYLIKVSTEGTYIEALHPVRAKILFEILTKEIGCEPESLILNTIKCIDSNYSFILLIDFFNTYKPSKRFIPMLSDLEFRNWNLFASVIKSLLWLDVKQYYEENSSIIKDVIQNHGSAWLMLMPIDISGLIQPEVISGELFIDILPNINKDKMRAAIEYTKLNLLSVQINYNSTNQFIQNSKTPLTSPETDNEWSSLGYSLFWLSHLGRQLKETECILDIDNIDIYDIHSLADAARGIFEHSALIKYNQISDKLVKRIIEAYCVIEYTETETEIVCKFIPPVFVETSDPPKNFNHYWVMYLLNLFDRIFPHKDYIDIEIVGMDILNDLGIPALDCKKRIPKKNRRHEWITELNSWFLTRCNFYNRPLTWNQFITNIDIIRVAANKSIDDTIALIDFIYKKRRIHQEHYHRLKDDINKINELTLSDILLPISAVDKHCLFREDMDYIHINDSRYANALAFHNYQGFKKSFNDYIGSLKNFHIQFDSVLTKRLKGQPIDSDNNKRLSLYNLYQSVKLLSAFQNEYNNMFAKYTTLDSSFCEQEFNNAIILLNMWEHVTTNPVREKQISYSCKQRYSKSLIYIEFSLKQAIAELNAVHLSDRFYEYISFELDPYNKTLEESITEAVLIIRSHLNKAIEMASERLIFEIQIQNIALIPTISQIPIGLGFKFDAYTIFDKNPEEISKIKIPVTIPDDILEQFNTEKPNLKHWRKFITFLGTIKTVLNQYNLSIHHYSNSKYKDGFSKHLGTVKNKIEQCTHEIISSVTYISNIVEGLRENAPSEFIDIILYALDILENIDNIIIQHQVADDIIDSVDTAITAAILLISYIKD